MSLLVTVLLNLELVDAIKDGETDCLLMPR